MARKSVKSTEAPQFDYKAFLTETMDSVTTRLNFDSDPIESATPMSTGMLVLDLLYGGGIRAGWYTNFGKEQSSKTTGALVIAANAVKAGVPIISYSDFEGSSVASMPYIRAILKTCGVDKTLGEVFGQKDQETGKWITAPIVRFSAETIGERFFDLLSATLRALPDKKSIGGKWWLVYEDNKVNKAKLAEYSDPSMAKRYGNGIWIPAPNAELQAIFIVDSYPAMNPSANDEDETNNSIALQARMFSKQLPRVKGYLAKKMVAVIGTNQLRANPLDRYHPEVEPCGESLKYSSDVRCKFTPRASGQPLWPKNFDKDTGWEIEKSVEAENGRDGYRYIHVKTIKNKLSTPNRIGWLRIWASDASGEGRGYDPVFDTAYYLYLTGQLVGRGRRSMKLLLNKAAVQPSITWEQIKLWVLGTTAQKKEICKALGFTKSFDLRKLCFHQLRTGVGEKLYVEHSQTTVEETED